MLPSRRHDDAFPPFARWHVPGSAPLAAPIWCFQSATLFPPWLITVLMECEGPWNVTPMTRARRREPGREELTAHLEGRSEEKRKILLKLLLSHFLFQDNCPCWISLNFLPYLLAYLDPQVLLSYWCCRYRLNQYKFHLKSNYFIIHCKKKYSHPRPWVSLKRLETIWIVTDAIK